VTHFFSPHRANGRGSKPSVHEFHCPMGNCDKTSSRRSRVGPQCPSHRIRMISLDVWIARNRKGR
jgi:endogenous inhibitor of DNA gyrase (YacG/DUF329 family)